jgi:hypothetical protein
VGNWEDVHQARKKAENQQKTRDKSKVLENQVFLLDFFAKKGLCIDPLDKSIDIFYNNSQYKEN